MPVIRADINQREAYLDGRSFGDTGAYERIEGMLSYAVDPQNTANRTIVDLELAPRDIDGRVQFRSDFILITPKDPDRGNRRLVVDVVNRGGGVDPARYNWLNPAGEHDELLFRRGFSVLSIGWQWDILPKPGLLGLEAPEAQKGEKTISGQVMMEMRTNEPCNTLKLSPSDYRPYPVADLDEKDAVLFFRDWPGAPDSIIPRGSWRFTRGADTANPDEIHVYLESGFQPVKSYYAVYTTNRAPVVGTGLLAVRDAATFLRNPTEQNPVPGGFERAYACGYSQSARLLREFVYLGLNLDENGQQAYDGLLPHVAGGRLGEFNNRFGQPCIWALRGWAARGPFADNTLIDPFSERVDGLLKRQRVLGGVPKIIHTNTSTEYWGGHGSLSHIEGSSMIDLEPAPETRIYHLCGTSHGAGSIEKWRITEGTPCLLPRNATDYIPLLRSAFINLDRWVCEGIEPPPSLHPRLDNAKAVTRVEALDSMPSIPGIVRPDPERLKVVREVDLGPQTELGIGRYPAKSGRTYPCFVSTLDSDGNEIAGIRLPDIEVPIGTHAGWNPRKPESGAPEQIAQQDGFTLFFPSTRAEREAREDPRLSIEERYKSRDDYLERVRAAAQRLVENRYLLEEDIDLVISACAGRYDVAIGEHLLHTRP